MGVGWMIQQQWWILSPTQAHGWTRCLQAPFIPATLRLPPPAPPFCSFSPASRLLGFQPLHVQPHVRSQLQAQTEQQRQTEAFQSPGVALAHPPSPPLSGAVKEASLSTEQLHAVQTADSCVRVVAGPGSGKTRVLTQRVVHLISHQGVLPSNILFITFTNQAANELRQRLKEVFGAEVVKKLMVGTFHSICAKILRSHPSFGLNKQFVIYDEGDSEKLLRNILTMAGKFLTGESTMTAVNVLEGHLRDFETMGVLTTGTPENLLLMKCMTANDNRQSFSSAVVRQLLHFIKAARMHKLECFLAERKNLETPRLAIRLNQAHFTFATLYENALRRSNAADFNDLIHLVVKLLHSQPDIREQYQEQWKYVLVDEFQDTDNVQYELILLLTSKYHNLFVVGDIDQAIYGWRGAEYIHMQKALELDFPSISTFQLRENYRSSESIVKAASIILEHSGYDRKIGGLESLRLVPIKDYMAFPIGIAGFSRPDNEAYFIVSTIRNLVHKREASWGSFALLYRTRAQSFPLEAALLKAGIPYKLRGIVPFYSFQEVRTLIAYLQVVANPRNDIALEYCLNVPARGIGVKSLIRVKTWATSNNLSLFRALEKIQDEGLEPKKLGLRPKARNGILDFINLLHHLQKKSTSASAEMLLETLIQRLNFKTYLKANSEDESAWERKLETIDQLLASASNYGVGMDGLQSFLEDLALLTDREEDATNSTKAVQDEVILSTLHASKGLEFDCVFVVGASDSLIPLHDCDLNEERRLFYVGITRACKRLYLTYSRTLPWQHQNSFDKKSRFLDEILRALPKKYYCVYE